jgi:hypothetical protein
VATSVPASPQKPAVPSKPSKTATTAIRLKNGLVSVPAESVHAPARLLIARLVLSPKVVSGRGRLAMTVSVRDTQRHVVRGVQVSVRGPRGSLLALSTTKVDGSATLRLLVSRKLSATHASVSLVVRAASRTLAIRRAVHVPVRR